MDDEILHMKKPVTIAELQRVVGLSAASASVDNRYLVFVVSKRIMSENGQKDFITLIEIATRQELLVWEGSSPLWSPVDHEIAYLAEHEGNTFLCVYSLESRLHRRLTTVLESAYFMGHLSSKNFAWSPDGSMIAYIGASPVPDPVDTHVTVIDRLMYKTKGGQGRAAVTDEMLSHVWTIPVSGGTPSLVTDTGYNEHSLCWSPDGYRIAFISNRTEDPDNNQLHDLYSIELSNGAVTRHTVNIGTAYQPAWAPNGQSIALLAITSKVSTNDSPAEDTHIFLIDIAGAAITCITRMLDRRVEQISWHPSAPMLYFLAGDEGTTAIYSVSVNDGSIHKIIGEYCHILEYSVAKTREGIFYINTDITHPAEIFHYDPSSYAVTRLTEKNAGFADSNILQPAETFWYPTFDNVQVQAWLMKPVRCKEGDRYPLVLVIHGGPHNMFGYDFEDRMQLLAASGFGVLFINPRGSSGYGQQFSSGCVLNWGGGDYKDLMAGVDRAIAQNDWIDAARLGVTGQSYGGYMTNWIITQTGRFKAAVADGSISNLISFAGTSLYHSLIESEFNGSAYDNFPLLWQWSPLRCVKNVTTPTLFLHGETDNEVPISQAEEMFIALKKLGVASRLVKYMGEGHGWRPDLKPANRDDVLTRIVAWMDKYLIANNQLP